jgi:hypothetical protein
MPKSQDRRSGSEDSIRAVRPGQRQDYTRGRSVGKSGSVFEGVPPGELGTLPPSVARRLARRPATEELRRVGGGF